MINCMAANFVPPLDHALKKLDVVRIPSDLAPLETVVFCPSIREYGIGVGDQEKRGWKTVSIKDGNGSFKLASQPVIKREGNECWFVHDRDLPGVNSITGVTCGEA